MRGFLIRLTVLTVLMIAVPGMASCDRVINSAADELMMYRWECSEDNGCCVSLSFDENNAALSVENEAYSLNIEGLCTADEDSLTIFDTQSENCYTFGYRLYGDRAELRLDSGVLELMKAE